MDHLHVHHADVSADVARLVASWRHGDGASIRSPGAWRSTDPGELHDLTGCQLTEKLRDAALVFAVSAFGRSYLISQLQIQLEPEPEHWDKIHVVPCGIDIKNWPRSTRELQSPGPLRILSIGRLEA